MLHQREPFVGEPDNPISFALATALRNQITAHPGCDLALLSALPVAVYMVDPSGRLTFWNEAACRLWGATPHHGDPIATVWQPVGADGPFTVPTSTPLFRALATGISVGEIEAVAARRDGSVVYHSTNPTPLLDREGRPTGAVDVLIDLTERRAAEARLRESEEHYRHAVELNPQMPWTADAGGRILHVNERWCRLTGQTSEAAIREGWTAVVSSDDLSRVQAAIAECGRTDAPLDVRFRAVLPDGSWRWLRARANPRRDAAGAVVRWYGTTEDIHDAVVAEHALAAAEERYRYAALATRDVFWDHDFETDTILWSKGLGETFGHVVDGDVSDGTFWLDNVHPDDREKVAASLDDAIATDATRWTAEYRFRWTNGGYAHVLDHGSLLRDGEGRVVRAIGAMLDFSDRKETEAELRLSEERLRLALAAAKLGIADFDAVTGHEHWSDELRDILGVPADARPNFRTWLSIVHPDDLPAALEQNRRTRAGDFGHEFRAVRRIVRPVDGEIRWVGTEGHVLRDGTGRVYRVVITVRDVTEDRRAQERVSWAATHDAMTGLANKAAFQQALTDALLPTGGETALLLVDLDHFKHVNDTLGHQAGDELLVEVGRRLTGAFPPDVTIARFGGDEFAIVLAGRGGDAAVAAANDALRSFDRPCVIDALGVDVRASIGVAVFPADGADASALLQAADIALYAAKAAGRNIARSYVPAMRAGMQLQISSIRQARQALADRAIVPFYQPKVALDGGEVVGAEALLRWRHPRHGLRQAGTILAALDDPELGCRIGDAMLAAVLDDLRRWLDAGEPVGRVALNASPVQVGAAGYAERLLSSLADHAVPPSAVEIEITETALIGARVDQVVEELRLLREAGVTVALDDFGTGYSSLSHLARFPVDVVKIDRSFVNGLMRTRADRAVVEAVLGLSSALGCGTVAEGVETREQASLLRCLGCSLGQGFLFSQAVPAASFEWRSRFSS